MIFGDALDVEIEGKYDLIFIDAAKAQNIKFFEKYKVNLDDNGTIITDNMNFHGLVNEDPENITTMNMFGRPLICMLNDGINSKLSSLPENCKQKLQKALKIATSKQKSNIIVFVF